MELALQLLLVFFLLAFIIILLYSMIFGGPYAPIGEQKIEAMLSLLKIKEGEKSVDLGSGDGRIVIALAQKGVVAHGYEVNPLLVLLARYKIRKKRLQKIAFIHWGDFWKADFSSYDIITIYLAPHIMSRLENKLRKDAKRRTRIAVNFFAFPTWKYDLRKDTIYLYRK